MSTASRRLRTRRRIVVVVASIATIALLGMVALLARPEPIRLGASVARRLAAARASSIDFFGRA
jgi:hypothetical protein